ncbi:SAM-dependent methyltransferase [Actinokineospora diospyrosa]|uniref:S-adenosyl methyltransferase n=1 Tax=Actinokineospora diospyrosa TaxID=103728 RepID=A0ABT1INQ0_9PSEU|nr:SAM-dependent methyltransferase [Actinokineospora diospyrosa]MCP2274295.1 S-adenosyl methyltransferase [Actinokineospora diospyrosa]
MPAAESEPWGDLPRGMAIDFDAPNQARLFDALLGGRDNYAADRDAVERLAALAPGVRQMARDHREWFCRALRLLVTQRGVDQFIDLGSGLPTVDNTHQIVQRHNPDAKVVYIDNDPVVLAHGRALLEENDNTHMLDYDITEPEYVTSDPDLRRRIDFDRPIGLMLCAVTGHLLDDVVARTTVHGWVDALAPGSYVVLSQQFDHADGSHYATLAAALRDGFRNTRIATAFRDRTEIECWFKGLELIEPGLTFLHEWWPDGPRMSPLTDMNFMMLGGMGRKV